MTAPIWRAAAVQAFGIHCKTKLAGPGEREAAIRAPLEALLTAAGTALGVSAVFHDEVRETSRRVRPDYGVSVGGAIVGYIEVKAPGRGIDPKGFTGHDEVQWERQRDLPNLVYTNGTDWRLYRDGDLVGEPVRFTGGDLASAGAKLCAPEEFEGLLTNFLQWKPAPITSVSALVRAIAPLTRLLRGEVLDQLALEKVALAVSEAAGRDPDIQPFSGLAEDWRAILFPTADDQTFADGYAQAVTFALLLARTEGIDITGRSLNSVGAALGAEHSLMGKALQLLTADVAADFKVGLDLLVRVVSAVEWSRVRDGRSDTYLHLYEHFLELYDNDLRKASGSYYTPRQVVEEMVRLTEEALETKLDKPLGFRDPDVFTVDPAMGTGTYLHTILHRVAERARHENGDGAEGGEVTQAAERLAGFELQMGPYAVAELRTSDLLKSYGATAPPGGMRLYVTDTLDDPHAAEAQLGSGLQVIAQSRRRANKIKARKNVTVVIGNPPYREHADAIGGWVTAGSGANGANSRGILDDFFDPEVGRHLHNLHNLYVYFWRWATWKTWESTKNAAGDGDAGIVCFITPSGYLAGPGFTGMREYMRQYASEGWIIDLTPEGQTPDVPTRIFPGVRQPLAIGLFIRKTGTSRDVPATIHYRALHGRQADKFIGLAGLRLSGNDWQDTRTDWKASFTPAPTGAWDTFPAMDDIFPWASPGVTGNRRWPFAPSSGILEKRWDVLQGEQDPVARTELFKETRDRTLAKLPTPLPGVTCPARKPLANDRAAMVPPERIGYRSFDRQWVLPDSRVLDMPRPTLWAARNVPGQVFVIEMHARKPMKGPGIVFSALVPDLHYFKGSEGGRTLPLYHADKSANVTPGLAEALTGVFGRPVTEGDLLAYVAGVVAHPAYIETFAADLSTPGIRVPVTSSAQLFDEAVMLGENVLWAQTYGAVYASGNRLANNIRYPSGHPAQPLARTAITSMPDGVRYDAGRGVVILGTGEFGPVSQAAWDYTVGGKNVISSWVNYRKSAPGGKKTSPLDNVHVEAWDHGWTVEFIDLLTVLTRLSELEDDQTALLARIVGGPLLSKANLSKNDVLWPETPGDRKPRRALNVAVDVDGMQGALDLV